MTDERAHAHGLASSICALVGSMDLDELERLMEGRTLTVAVAKLQKRLMSAITVTDGGCWERGKQTSNPDRYRTVDGVAATGRWSIRAHRLSWILNRGPIADGLFVLHRCDNRPCCNPDHLFLGTAQDNVDDMIQKGRDNTAPQRARSAQRERDKTHCKNGHPFSGDNVRIETVSGSQRRACRQCARERERARRQRLRGP